jgi:hypothetical protein
MGWSLGFDSNWGRDVGYGVPAICDHPKCNKEIDRGLSYVCGSDMYGGEHGCGLYFCSDHRYLHVFRDGCVVDVCYRCDHYKHNPYQPKPDVKKWIIHKMTDPSWAQWRKDNHILDYDIKTGVVTSSLIISTGDNVS